MDYSKSEIETLQTAIQAYGETSQLLMLFEEMSELQKAVCKAIRFPKRNHRAVAEEIADVEIMLEQCKMIFGVHEESEMWRTDKIIRLKKRLGLLPEDDE